MCHWDSEAVWPEFGACNVFHEKGSLLVDRKSKCVGFVDRSNHKGEEL